MNEQHQPSSSKRMAWSDQAMMKRPLQSEGAAAAAAAVPLPPPRPALVLVDYPESQCRLVRPVAIKVSAATDLYHAAYQQQLGGAHIHQGVVEAHAWNEKWHPMANMPDRSSGAKNPSPEDNNNDNDDGDSILMVLQEDVLRETSHKRRHDQQVEQVAAARSRPNLIRPVALRIQRPQPQPQRRHVIPSDILAHPPNLQNHHHCNLSPLSLPSANSSVASSASQTRSVTSGAHHVIPDDSTTATTTPTQITLTRHFPSASTGIQVAVRDAHDGVLRALASTGGETVGNSELTVHVDFLKQHYAAAAAATLASQSPYDHAEWQASRGMWLSLTKPVFFGCLGTTDAGDPLYSLGRMSFDMFSPTNLVCSLQGSFNHVAVVGDRSHDNHLIVPKSLKDEVENADSVLQTYNIVTAFTIECDSADDNTPNKDVHRPIKGIMTTYGYTLPDPTCPSRQSVWITGGRIEPNNDVADQTNWKRHFALHPPSKSLGEQAKFLAVKLLMGATMPSEMNEDGSMEYTFTRPIGGHGTAYVDTVYVDKTMRIVQGHRGTLFVFSKLHDDEQ